MKYTSNDVQEIIDDLDFAQHFIHEMSAESHMECGLEVANENYERVKRSLQHASDILCRLPDEVIEGIDKVQR